MKLSDRHKISQEKRNFKITAFLITAWSRVQVLAGPYKKEARRFRPSCFFFVCRLLIGNRCKNYIQASILPSR